MLYSLILYSYINALIISDIFQLRSSAFDFQYPHNFVLPITDNLSTEQLLLKVDYLTLLPK
jgi:hypothetical protein